MLANLTSLIWGSENTPVTAAAITTDTTSSLDLISTKDNYEESPEGFSKFSIRATTPTDEEEADWVLVDRTASPSSQPVLVEREESPMKENTVEESENQVAEVPPARGGVAQPAPSLLRAIDVLRPAQKAQRRREERRLKRAPLDRSNKVREVAAAGNKRAKRCDLMAPGKFSRVVNNRKC